MSQVLGDPAKDDFQVGSTSLIVLESYFRFKFDGNFEIEFRASLFPQTLVIIFAPKNHF